MNDRIKEIGQLPYLRAKSGGGREQASLPILRLTSPRVPPGLHGCIVTGDLQGVAPSRFGSMRDQLLGISLVEELAVLADAGTIEALSGVGVLLAGDLFSAPRANQRGASGHVGEVWSAFAGAAEWVAGVLGNHDKLDRGELRALRKRGRASVLDGELVDNDGVCVAGISGIIGARGKALRRTPEQFCQAVRLLSGQRPDVLVMHQPPRGPASDQLGSPELTKALLKTEIELVVCGHCHWRDFVWDAPFGRVLNVDGRVVILERAAPPQECSASSVRGIGQ